MPAKSTFCTLRATTSSRGYLSTDTSIGMEPSQSSQRAFLPSSKTVYGHRSRYLFDSYTLTVTRDQFGTQLRSAPMSPASSTPAAVATIITGQHSPNHTSLKPHSRLTFLSSKIPHAPESPQERIPQHHSLPAIREEVARFHKRRHAHFPRVGKQPVHYKRVLEGADVEPTTAQTEGQCLQLPSTLHTGCSGTSTVPAARLSPCSDSAPGRTGGSDRGSWNPKAPPAAERNGRCMGFGRVGGIAVCGNGPCVCAVGRER